MEPFAEFPDPGTFILGKGKSETILFYSSKAIVAGMVSILNFLPKQSDMSSIHLVFAWSDSKKEVAKLHVHPQELTRTSKKEAQLIFRLHKDSPSSICRARTYTLPALSQTGHTGG